MGVKLPTDFCTLLGVACFFFEPFFIDKLYHAVDGHTVTTHPPQKRRVGCTFYQKKHRTLAAARPLF